MRKQNLVCLGAAAFALWAIPSARGDFSNTVMSFNPAAYWRLNETTQPPPPDVALNLGTLGTKGQGYYLGGATHPQPGALTGSTDTAALFDGTSGSVVVPFSPALGINAPFSAECWVSPASDPTVAGLTAVLSCGHFGDPRSGWLIYQNTDGYNFRIYNQNGLAVSASVDAGGTPQVGSWYHVVGVFDGTTAYLYVNGALVGSQVVTASPAFVPNTDGNLTIGTRSDNSFYFNGTVDEVAVYTNALSLADVQAHYQNGISASPSTPYNQLILTKNPLVYYRLDEPAYTPGTLPTALNSGLNGASDNGAYGSGCLPGVAGVPFTGLGANNYACAFNGLAGTIDAGGGTDLNITGSMAVMAWLKGNPANGRFMTPVGKGDSSWRIDVDGNGLAHFADGSAPDVVGTTRVDDDQWHFVVGVYDASVPTNYLYVDNVLDGSGAGATVAGNNLDVTIGTAPDYLTGRIFDGSVDEVAVFTNVLTSAQIQQIYYAANIPPVIVVQPQGPAGPVYEGQSLSLTVSAVGNPTLAYQWTKGGANISGQTSATLALNSIHVSDSGSYAVVITNSYGSVTSSVVALVVQSGPPLILTQPVSETRYAGLSATFSVVAGGSTPLSYQWYFGASAVSGATGSSYTIANVQAINQGSYSCVVTNPFGFTNTASVSLTVLPTPTNAFAATVLADGPLLYLRLNETNGTVAYDYVGGHDGIYFNATLDQKGYSAVDTDGSVIVGPGTASFVGIPGVDFSSGGDFTLEAWVKAGAQPSGDAGIISKGTGGGGEQFNLDCGHDVTGPDHLYRFFVRNTGGSVTAINSSAAADGTWQHVVAVFAQSSGTMALYVNGNQVGSATAPAGGLLSSTNSISVGSRQSGSGPYDLNWFGNVDEVAIYRKALSSTQVQNHFAARYGTTTKPVISIQPASTTNYATVAATFTVEAGGSDPLSYQWQFKGTDIPGANSPVLTISPLDVTNEGNYTVQVSNGNGSVTSTPATLTVLPAPTGIDTSAGLVAHIKFDGNMLDWSGQANNVTNKGASLVPGKVGTQALNYNTAGSTHNYATFGFRPELQFSSNVDFTIAYWIQYTNLGSSFPQDLPIIGNIVNSTYNQGVVLAQSGGPWLWTYTGNGYNTVDAGGTNAAISDQNWHHFAVTFNRTGVATTYLDGAPVDARPIAGRGTVDTGQGMFIGQDPTGGYGVDGEANIDDLGIWRRVLSPLEVAGLYAAGNVNGVGIASAPVRMSIQVNGNQAIVNWAGGFLQSADLVTGPYTDVSGATSPFTVTATTGKKFYRVRQ